MSECLMETPFPTQVLGPNLFQDMLGADNCLELLSGRERISTPGDKEGEDEDVNASTVELQPGQVDEGGKTDEKSTIKDINGNYCQTAL